MNSYFSHDSNARNSEKLLQVRMKYGAAGYGAYFMILERLRDEADYMSVKDYNMIAFDLRVDASMIKAIVEDFGLFVFTDDGKYFYSEGFKKRMAIMDQKTKKRAEAGKKGANARWQTNSNAMAKPKVSHSKRIAKPSENDGNKIKLNKIKEKNSNVQNESEQPSHDGHSLADDFEKLWKLYPSKKGKKKAFDAYKRAIKKGTTNKEIQNGIVDLIKHQDPKYYPNGSTWFNGERWTDSYETPEPPVSQSSEAQQKTKESPEIAKMKFIYNTYLDHDSDLEAAVPAIQAKRPELSEEDIKKALFPERYYKTEEW